MQRSHGVIASQNTAWKNMLVPSDNKTKQSTLKVKEIQDVYVRCAHGTSCVSNIIVTTIVLFISTVYIVTAATQAPGDPVISCSTKWSLDMLARASQHFTANIH